MAADALDIRYMAADALDLRYMAADALDIRYMAADALDIRCVAADAWCGERAIFIDNLLVLVHWIIEMIVVERHCAIGV